MNNKFLCFLFYLVVSTLWVPHALAFEEFKVGKIEMLGLERISSATVFNYLPVKAGEQLTREKSADVIRELFSTGFFDDIKLQRDGDILVVQLLERPSIAKIVIKGNDAIKSEELTDGLKKVNFAEGRIFNRSLLEKVEQELERQYFALGHYGVEIDSVIKPQERNRVAIDLTIKEGAVARVRKINVIGNKAFTEDQLLGVFGTKPYRESSTFVSKTKYSRQQLSADIELMKSYYMDRGYINVNVDSTQVSISPDKQDVFVTLNVSEGGKFTVSDIDLAGELIVDKKELRDLIDIQPGDVFSRRIVAESSNKISDRLGLEGFFRANVNPAPEVDDKNKKVKLTFYVNPGKRVYVRRVEFYGHFKTHDEVLRRELRQMESGWVSTQKLERSRVRLQRTGFFENVAIETPQVPGRPDLVDVIYNVTETSSGSITASLGYGQGSGIIVQGSVNQNNFMGTGERVSAEVNTTRANTVYSFSFTDPYYTIDGISRSFRLYYRKTDASQILSVADYNANAYGASLSFGVPLSEYRSGRLGLAYDNNEILKNSATPAAYEQFLQDNGNQFDTIKLTGSWSFDTRDRSIFADKGTYIVLSGDAVLPFTDMTFYKATYKHQWYIPIVDKWTLFLDGQVSYGDGYGNMPTLPFFENFYGGGGQSLRGFRDNSLGPKSSSERSLGGNRRVTGSAELILPNPFSAESRSVRFSAFFDVGNVYGYVLDESNSLLTAEKTDITKLRASYGVGAIWIAPIGALRLSWAKPVRSFSGDKLQSIQFSIGAPF